MESLAHQYNIKGGNRSIINWLQRWDGSPESLEPRERKVQVDIQY